MTTPDATAKAGQTPLPWKAVMGEAKWEGVPIRSGGLLVAMARAAGGPIQNAKANARLIVEAVNSHASLEARVEELEKCLAWALEYAAEYAEGFDREVNPTQTDTIKSQAEFDRDLQLARLALSKQVKHE